MGQPLLLLGGLMAAGLVLRRIRDFLDVDLIDHFVSGKGPWGELIFVAAGMAACAGGVPRQVVAFGAGYAFGPWSGVALGIVAQMLGCGVVLAWSRALGRAWVARRVYGRFARLDAFLAANPFTATLTLRLMPAGNNALVNLLAGVSAIPVAPFLLASLIGYLPQTVMFSFLGAGFAVAETTRIAIGISLFVASLGLCLLLLRRRSDISPGSLGRPVA